MVFMGYSNLFMRFIWGKSWKINYTDDLFIGYYYGYSDSKCRHDKYILIRLD